MEILASTEQQLRIALAARSPLVVAIEPNGILLPRQEGSAAELLHDPRGELRALAEELLRSGICSFLFTHPINVGELDLLAHEISRVPRSATPGDTASRKLWDNWIKSRRRRRDSHEYSHRAARFPAAGEPDVRRARLR